VSGGSKLGGDVVGVVLVEQPASPEHPLRALPAVAFTALEVVLPGAVLVDLLVKSA
jgi:hypothetical protein